VPTIFAIKSAIYLEKYLKAHHPVTPGKVSPAIVGDPARYIKALREETSYFDVQGLKFGDNRAYRFPIDEFYIRSPFRPASVRGRFRCRTRWRRTGNCWWWATPAQVRARS
jgi:hypothetical protein